MNTSAPVLVQETEHRLAPVEAATTGLSDIENRSEYLLNTVQDGMRYGDFLAHRDNSTGILTLSDKRYVAEFDEIAIHRDEGSLNIAYTVARCKPGGGRTVVRGQMSLFPDGKAAYEEFVDDSYPLEPSGRVFGYVPRDTAGGFLAILSGICETEPTPPSSNSRLRKMSSWLVNKT